MNESAASAAQSSASDRRMVGWVFLLVAVAALAMSAPTISGEFLGGDDIQLVRNHVLVNRPSWSHFVELFDPAANRDLYQPVALVSFQANFAIVRALQLDRSGPEGGAWVFHLTNMLLHAGCAVLVSALAWRLSGRRRIAWITGVLFAIHPLNVETVAWINGRMMLLSTLFVLAAVLLLERYRLRGRWWIGVAVVACVVLCHLSKLRVSLPFLLAIPVMLTWQRPPRRWWVVWGIALVVTGGLAVLNVGLSESMLTEAQSRLAGSRIARSVWALGWYVQHVFVPIGLSPYHATSAHMGRFEPRVLMFAAVVVSAVLAVVVMGRRSRLVWLGGLWFLAAVAITLPLVASRNLSVAERYMYLPLVGGLWPIALLLDWFSQRMLKPAATLACCVLVGCLLSLSWYAGTSYRDDVARTLRVAVVNNTDPRLRVKHAWALFRAGEFIVAREYAEQVTHPTVAASGEVLSDAWQVIGESLAREGRAGESLDAIRRAAELDPDRAAVQQRLGAAYQRVGDDASALAALERSAEIAPNFNPALTDLAQAYRKENRIADARRVYEQILANNPHDQLAASALAELEIADGSYAAARQRLERVLADEPGADRVRALLAWTCFLADDNACAVSHVPQVLQPDGFDPLGRIVQVGLLLDSGDARNAVTQGEMLAMSGVLSDAFLFDAFATVAQRRAMREPADPWPYYLMCLACNKTNRMDAARIAADEFKKRMPDPAWHAKVDELLGRASQK